MFRGGDRDAGAAIVLVMAPSGSGKTTMLSMLGGLLPRSEARSRSTAST
jgi:ABC-type lipoprotein export system ATPase subunit